MDEIALIPVDQIIPDPENLRQAFDEDEIAALAENLVAIGQTDPVQVFRREDGTFDLFDGERRWRAARLAGLASLRAIVVPRPAAQELLVKKNLACDADQDSELPRGGQGPRRRASRTWCRG